MTGIATHMDQRELNKFFSKHFNTAGLPLNAISKKRG